MDTRLRYQTLLERHGLTQAESAVLLSQETQRPCSTRAVRSWLNDPAKPSSRACPEWAVAALERAIARNSELSGLKNQTTDH